MDTKTEGRYTFHTAGKQNSLKISVKLEMDYKDELADKTSKTFKEKKSDLEAAVSKNSQMTIIQVS